MTTSFVTRRGSALRAVCALALLTGLVAPATAFAADDSSFALAPALGASPLIGTLNSGTDHVDRFSLALDEGDVLSLDLTGDAYQDFDLSIYMPGVVDAAPGAEEPFVAARSNAPDTAQESLDFLVPPGAAGTYFVELSALSGAFGEYELTWSKATGIGDAVRLSGSDRYATSYAASRSSFATASAVVIASGANFPDALSAAGLAGALDCPVLLAPPVTAVDDPRLGPLYSEINRLDAHTAYVIGGESAVSSVLFDQVETWVAAVERIPGATRYETAQNVAEKIDEINGAPADIAFVVRGDSFADALAASPFAFSQALPILLTPSGSLDVYTNTYLELNNVDEVLIAGGTGAVSAAVAAQLDALNAGATDVVRMSGADRYETAARVASDCIDRGWGDWSTIGIATGTNFPDALSGGAALGTRGGSLLLTTPTALSAPAAAAIDTNATPGTMALVLGGTSAVNESVITTIRGLLP